jgi:itaconate CoA-transferase
MGFPAYFTKYGGKSPARAGASHAGVAPYGPFQSGDQKPVFLSVQNEREWKRFCEIVLQHAELATDPRFASSPVRFAHRSELDVEINAVFSRLTAAEIVQRLEEAQIANARMNSMQEFLEHPQLAARNRWRDIDSPVGPLAALIPPADIEGVDPMMGAIPDVGQHTDDILKEIGFDAATIAAWREQGVI